MIAEKARDLIFQANLWYSNQIMSVQEAIGKIKESENQAEQIIRQANLQAQEIIKQAGKQAEEYILKKTEEAREKAEQAARKIINQAESERIDTGKTTRGKIAQLEEAAAKNVPSAVDWLVGQLDKLHEAKWITRLQGGTFRRFSQNKQDGYRPG